MPHYYFDLVDDQTVHDHTGVDLAGIEEARAYATTFVQELMDSKPTLLGESQFAWKVRISDARFKRVLELPFSSLLDKPDK